jgi:hypothetical protein
MLLTINRRSIFFGRRLLNKPLKKQSNFEHSYDPTAYLVAMKDF